MPEELADGLVDVAGDGGASPGGGKAILPECAAQQQPQDFAGPGGAAVRGCSDVCAVRVAKIRMAGVAEVKARAKAEGRADPGADMALVSKSYLMGTNEAARQSGCSETYARNMVRRYAEYADAILRERAEKRG